MLTERQQEKLPQEAEEEGQKERGRWPKQTAEIHLHKKTQAELGLRFHQNAIDPEESRSRQAIEPQGS